MVESLSNECRAKIIEEAIPASIKAILVDKDVRLEKFLNELAWYMAFGELPKEEVE